MDSAAEIPILVPDIGDFEAVEVIEIIARPGDDVAVDDPLITLESDKATMEIPSPRAGRVVAIKVAIGDRVSQGALIAVLAPAEVSATATEPSDQPAPPAAAAPEPVHAPAAAPAPVTTGPRPPPVPPVEPAATRAATKTHASPGVRKFARELGADLTRITGSGPKGRVLKTDIQQYVKDRLQQADAPVGRALPSLPEIDFAQYGAIERVPLGKIRRIAGQHLHRSWTSAPHVTQFDEADITDLEAFRKTQIEAGRTRGVKLTLVAFVVKATGVALAEFPDFNASLTTDGESLIRKKYFHIGVAVNTDQGLFVPVIRDVDHKGLFEIAAEIATLGAKARERRLGPADLQGGCFTVSSLGGIGGTTFTPIINVPEVAILGVSPAAIKPRHADGQFVPRLMLPLALSYDHRVIDGAAGAAFTRFLGTLLGDIRHLLL